ncbi:MAG: hypothetical protein WC262_08050 [Bacteroidales bacterium]|jgi:hypothetical protein
MKTAISSQSSYGDVRCAFSGRRLPSATSSKRAAAVQVNNPHVKEDIQNGIHDVSGLLIVDEIRNTISDNITGSP